MEEIVTFKNNLGQQLFGVLHIPESNIDKKIGINLLNPGLKSRVAPNRLNVKIARKLCADGYYVFRFDPRGIGDSEGECFNDMLLLEIGDQVQKGFFVEDTLQANDFFYSSCNLDRLYLAGSCGGAITALLTAKEDKRVDGLCLIDVPIKLRSPNMSFADKVTADSKKASWLFTEYIKRLFKLSSWYRFITFKSNYRALKKVFYMKFQSKLNPRYKKTKVDENIEIFCQTHQLNMLFFEAFSQFASKNKSLLFIMAENYADTEIFRAYFEPTELYQSYAKKGVIESLLVKEANHIYTLYEWQNSLINRFADWLQDQQQGLNYSKNRSEQRYER